MRCGACCSKNQPDDYVVATGVTHSVREFAALKRGHRKMPGDVYQRTAFEGLILSGA